MASNEFLKQPAAPDAGFSVFELLVGLAVMAQVLVVVLLLFDVNNKVARVQTSVADMQQSQRIAQHELVRYLRMAGRGGLRSQLALDFRDNVTNTAREMLPGNTTDYLAVEDSDVLTVRGIFGSPIYQVDAVNLAAFVKPDPGAGDFDGVVQVNAVSPSGVPQTLTDMINADPGEALLLVSPVDDAIFCVAEITQVTDNAGASVSIEFTVSGTTRSDAFAAEFGAYPADLTAVAFAGILEEYRFYNREAFPAGATGDITELQPKLSQARYYPGTDEPWDGDNATLAIDIAENILDLQVAVGIDLSGDRTIDSTSAADADEWLFNHQSENAWTGAWLAPPVHYVRLSTLARGATPEGSYVAPPINQIENHDYNEPDSDQNLNAAEKAARLYRRRLLETQVDLRNLG